MSYSGCPLCGYVMHTRELMYHFANKHPDYPGQPSGNHVPEITEETRNRNKVVAHGVRALMYVIIFAVLIILAIPLLLFDFLNDDKFWEAK